MEGSRKLHLEWASVWSAKCKEFLRKSKDFRLVWGRTLLEHSLKLHLEWASVWNAKFKELQRKGKDFRSVGGAHLWGIR